MPFPGSDRGQRPYDRDLVPTPLRFHRRTEAAAIVMELDALISPATSSVLGLRAGMTPSPWAGSFSYARESVETIPFTINLNLSLGDAAASWFRNCFRRDDCSTLSCPMKFNLRSLADAAKHAPSPRSRWCSYCKRNEHHLCPGFRRVNHGLTLRCECPHRERRDPIPAAGSEPAAAISISPIGANSASVTAKPMPPATYRLLRSHMEHGERPCLVPSVLVSRFRTAPSS